MQIKALAPAVFTQGDTVVLQLQATDESGNPQNISGATFSSQMLGPLAVGPVTFGNAKHTIVNAGIGSFTLNLTANDSASIGYGNNKDIVTSITISGAQTTYRGVGLATVWPPIPLA